MHEEAAIRRRIVGLLGRSAGAPPVLRWMLTPLVGGCFGSLVLLLTAASIRFTRRVPVLPALPRPLNLVVGLPVLICGAGLMLSTTGLFVLTGGTPVPVNPPRRLVTDGPYGLSRNPMISGLGLFLFGLGQMVRAGLLAWITAPLIITLMLLEVGLIEEPELERRFGDDYRAYRSRTPMVVPRWRAVRHGVL